MTRFIGRFLVTRQGNHGNGLCRVRVGKKAGFSRDLCVLQGFLSRAVHGLQV